MNRRTALQRIAGAMALPLTAVACTRKEGSEGRMTASSAIEQGKGSVGGKTMPVLFVAHGAPPLLEDEPWKAELAAWAKALPRPKAILSISAHWEAKPIAIGATETIPLIYDFYGFPAHFYQMQYRSPGAPETAARVRDLLGARGIAWVDEPGRGLDHGTWVPLVPMYPDADVPVLQVSLPGLDPKAVFAFGEALAPLRDEGVLVMGSGFLTHNMRSLGERVTPSWASEFDAWIAETLARRDVDALVDFARRAPAASLAHPRTEHFAPVIASAAAAQAKGGDIAFPITGYWGLAPSFSRRSVQIG